jgi:hypothetical protein
VTFLGVTVLASYFLKKKNIHLLWLLKLASHGISGWDSIQSACSFVFIFIIAGKMVTFSNILNGEVNDYQKSESSAPIHPKQSAL